MSRLIFGLLVILATSRLATADSRPNIVFILADDLGIGDVGCYGGDRCLIETPNIDALARGGLRFTDAHVSASVCVPTRVGIMTGRYPWRFGPPQPGGAWGLLGPRFDTDTFTLGRMFQQAGYRAGYVGKWHLGTVMTTRDGNVQNEKNVDYTQPLKVGPVQYGFDSSFILPGSLDMYPYAFAKNNVWQGEVTAQKGWSAFNRVGPAEKDFEDHRVLETFYHEAESFLASQQNEQPFFLYLALTAPHTPTSPSEKYRGKSSLGLYGDFVMEVDHAVERVVAALKQNGQYDNTLVLFSSDHGPGPYAGNIRKATPGQIHLLEERGHFPSGPHRGYKFSAYEGGLRVPLIANWPGVTEPGSETRAIVGLNDLMATFADLSNQPLKEDQAPDSISFAKLLREPASAGTRKNLIMQSVAAFVVREGDWKLCLCPGSGSPLSYGNEPRADVAWRTAIERFGRNPRREDLTSPAFVQLFNVSDDPHEDENLAAKHPDRVAQMIALLEKQIANGRSTPGPKLQNGRARVPLHARLPAFVRDGFQE
ncbi:MAG: sulfatase family protein [Planctomycetota bacterium]